MVFCPSAIRAGNGDQLRRPRYRRLSSMARRARQRKSFVFRQEQKRRPPATALLGNLSLFAGSTLLVFFSFALMVDDMDSCQQSQPEFSVSEIPANPFLALAQIQSPPGRKG